MVSRGSWRATLFTTQFFLWKSKSHRSQDNQHVDSSVDCHSAPTTMQLTAVEHEPAAPPTEGRTRYQACHEPPETKLAGTRKMHHPASQSAPPSITVHPLHQHDRNQRWLTARLQPLCTDFKGYYQVFWEVLPDMIPDVLGLIIWLFDN